MDYNTAKEQRVKKNWNKRGLAGLRSELLTKVAEHKAYEWTDDMFVRQVAMCVYGNLPRQDWVRAHDYISETCGLMSIDIEDEQYLASIMQIQLMEETLREDDGQDN